MNSHSPPQKKSLSVWLLSRQNLGLKIQISIAAIALLTVGILAFNERSIRQKRQIAYDTIISIDVAKQPGAVMVAAEDFLSDSPLSGKDAREETVKDLYTQAFVTWFIQQPDNLDNASLQSQVERYKALTESR